MASDPVYDYVPHDRTRARLSGEAHGPVKVKDQHDRSNSAARFNAWFAVLHEAVQIQEHLLAQDKMLDAMVTKLEAQVS